MRSLHGGRYLRSEIVDPMVGWLIGWLADWVSDDWKEGERNY
jgi:hypothetical protein